MSYLLDVSPSAQDEIKRLPGHVRQRVRRAVKYGVIETDIRLVAVVAVRKRPPYDYDDLPELFADLP